MPRGDFNIYFSSGRRGYVKAEEAVGIGLLVVVLVGLFILGCWYLKKRSGYKLIRSTGSGSTGFTAGQYSEAGTSADNKMALTDFGSFRSVIKKVIMNPEDKQAHSIMDPQLYPSVPNAPPAYEKISSGPLPPPYSP